MIGANERISPYQALQAITTNAVYQYFEEDRKGSLETGKLAGSVILSENPLKVDPSAIKDIKVLKTFKERNLIFERSNQS